MNGWLQRFTNIHRDELPSVLAASLFFFLVLTALMVLRPARESIGMSSGMDSVRWLFVGTAVVTLAVNPVFGWMVSRFRRLSFITATYLFFAASLCVFYGLLVVAPQAVGEVSGRIFYVWYSVFNLFVTMVFWALMADRFSLDQGKRFFAFIAAGGTLGAIFGPFLTTVLTGVIGTPALMLVAAGFLVLSVAAVWLVAALQPEDESPETAPGDAMRGVPTTAPAVSGRDVIGGSAWEGFRAVARSPYLMGIAGYVLVIAIVATFLYFTRLAMVAERAGGIDEQTTLFAQIDLVTQTATLLLQLVIAGHLMRRLGVAFTLAVLPMIVVLGMIGLVTVGTLAAFVVFDAAYRAVQRAVMRPARETLFTVVSREDKYKSKSVIDTFAWRTGDVVGAGTEGVLAGLGAGFVALATFTIPLAAVWAGLGLWLGRAQGRIAQRHEGAPLAAAAPAVGD